MTVDETMPTGRWEFDAAVADAFDDMLARSIPQYDVMRAAVADVAARYIGPGDTVVDLGCSRGEALRSVRERVAGELHLVGCEVSPPMLAAARQRFEDDGNALILDVDLRHDYPQSTAAVTLAVLVVQFVPIEYRQQLLRRAFQHTKPGGALILVEKVIGSSAETDDLLVDLYLTHKRRSGYSDEAIDRKRLALEGVLVPVTSSWNEEALRAAGFAQVEGFWRWMNFAGWVAVRG